MTENFIQLKKDDVLRLHIRTNEGTPTGEVLEFDLYDSSLLLKYQELIEKNKKNKEYLKNQLMIIDKRQDVSGKKLLSKNEEDKIKAINDFFKKQIEVYNIFLGNNGAQKLLNGRKIGWNTLEEIDEIIEKQILPYLEKTMDNIAEKVKKKYLQATNTEEEIEVLD